MSRRTTAWWRSDLTYAERLCDGGFVRSSSRSRSPSTLMVVAFMLNLYQNECGDQAGSQLSLEDRAHLFERSRGHGQHRQVVPRVGASAQHACMVAPRHTVEE